MVIQQEMDFCWTRQFAVIQQEISLAEFDTNFAGIQEHLDSTKK